MRAGQKPGYRIAIVSRAGDRIVTVGCGWNRIVVASCENRSGTLGRQNRSEIMSENSIVVKNTELNCKSVLVPRFVIIPNI